MEAGHIKVLDGLESGRTPGLCFFIIISCSTLDIKPFSIGDTQELYIVHCRNDFGKNADVQSTIIRLQTLYHAQKNKMDSYILELVSWLHRLITLVRFNGHRALAGKLPAPERPVLLQSETPANSNLRPPNAQISAEDRRLLEGVMKSRKLVPGLSKSQELVIPNKKMNQIWSLSRSAGNSPCNKVENPKANNVLDILDGLA